MYACGHFFILLANFVRFVATFIKVKGSPAALLKKRTRKANSKNTCAQLCSSAGKRILRDSKVYKLWVTLESACLLGKIMNFKIDFRFFFYSFGSW